MNIVLPFLNRARSHPDLAAVTCSGHSLCYAELAQRSQALAGAMLQRMGLVPGQRVILCMENRAAFFETLLACWVAGLCPVPVNAKLHPKEVWHIAQDSGASALFCSESLHAGLQQALTDSLHDLCLISVDDPDYAQMQAHTPMQAAALEPDDTAWIFYTSGTTGVPKGAMLSHRNLLQMCLQYGADIDGVRPGDTHLHVAPLSHGSGLYSLPHLFNGGHQVIEPVFNPDVVFEALQRYPRVSFFAAPTMLTRMLRASHGRVNPAGNLQLITYGGGPMYVSDLLQCLSLFGPRMVQIYGQGESPMTITRLSQLDHEGAQDAAHLARLASCGTARTGVQVRVVDEAGRDRPCGEPGEVITRSDTRMRGYWNNPVATAAAIRDGWLWTGDIGALDERGYLTLLDRSKDLIIRGGSNIYPREIEEVLLRHPAVAEVSVIGAASADLGEEPVAFVVCTPGATVNAHTLDALCLDHLARFKRPRNYHFVSDLPKNNYGKILKTALRQQLKQGGT
jgi:long-chain acyl-CoA synthetase